MLVRATINLPGLPAGHRANVDPDKPYIKRCLAAGYLEPVLVKGFNGESQEREVDGANS